MYKVDATSCYLCYRYLLLLFQGKSTRLEEVVIPVIQILEQKRITWITWITPDPNDSSLLKKECSNIVFFEEKGDIQPCQQ